MMNSRSRSKSLSPFSGLWLENAFLICRSTAATASSEQATESKEGQQTRLRHCQKGAARRLYQNVSKQQNEST